MRHHRAHLKALSVIVLSLFLVQDLGWASSGLTTAQQDKLMSVHQLSTQSKNEQAVSVQNAILNQDFQQLQFAIIGDYTIQFLPHLGNVLFIGVSGDSADGWNQKRFTIYLDTQRIDYLYVGPCYSSGGCGGNQEGASLFFNNAPSDFQDIVDELNSHLDAVKQTSNLTSGEQELLQRTEEFVDALPDYDPANSDFIPNFSFSDSKDRPNEVETIEVDKTDTHLIVAASHTYQHIGFQYTGHRINFTNLTIEGVDIDGNVLSTLPVSELNWMNSVRIFQSRLHFALRRANENSDASAAANIEAAMAYIEAIRVRDIPLEARELAVAYNNSMDNYVAQIPNSSSYVISILRHGSERVKVGMGYKGYGNAINLTDLAIRYEGGYSPQIPIVYGTENWLSRLDSMIEDAIKIQIGIDTSADQDIKEKAARTIHFLQQLRYQVEDNRNPGERFIANIQSDPQRIEDFNLVYGTSIKADSISPVDRGRVYDIAYDPNLNGEAFWLVLPRVAELYRALKAGFPRLMTMYNEEYGTSIEPDSLDGGDRQQLFDMVGSYGFEVATDGKLVSSLFYIPGFLKELAGIFQGSWTTSDGRTRVWTEGDVINVTQPSTLNPERTSHYSWVVGSDSISYSTSYNEGGRNRPWVASIPEMPGAHLSSLELMISDIDRVIEDNTGTLDRHALGDIWYKLIQQSKKFIKYSDGQKVAYITDDTVTIDSYGDFSQTPVYIRFDRDDESVFDSTDYVYGTLFSFFTMDENPTEWLRGIEALRNEVGSILSEPLGFNDAELARDLRSQLNQFVQYNQYGLPVFVFQNTFYVEHNGSTVTRRVEVTDNAIIVGHEFGWRLNLEDGSVDSLNQDMTISDSADAEERRKNLTYLKYLYSDILSVLDRAIVIEDETAIKLINEVLSYIKNIRIQGLPTDVLAAAEAFNAAVPDYESFSKPGDWGDVYIYDKAKKYRNTVWVGALYKSYGYDLDLIDLTIKFRGPTQATLYGTTEWVTALERMIFNIKFGLDAYKDHPDTDKYQHMVDTHEFLVGLFEPFKDPSGIGRFEFYHTVSAENQIQSLTVSKYTPKLKIVNAKTVLSPYKYTFEVYEINTLTGEIYNGNHIQGIVLYKAPDDEGYTDTLIALLNDVNNALDIAIAESRDEFIIKGLRDSVNYIKSIVYGIPQGEWTSSDGNYILNIDENILTIQTPEVRDRSDWDQDQDPQQVVWNIDESTSQFVDIDVTTGESENPSDPGNLNIRPAIYLRDLEFARDGIQQILSETTNSLTQSQLQLMLDQIDEEIAKMIVSNEGSGYYNGNFSYRTVVSIQGDNIVVDKLDDRWEMEYVIRGGSGYSQINLTDHSARYIQNGIYLFNLHNTDPIDILDEPWAFLRAATMARSQLDSLTSEIRLVSFPEVTNPAEVQRIAEVITSIDQLLASNSFYRKNHLYPDMSPNYTRSRLRIDDFVNLSGILSVDSSSFTLFTAKGVNDEWVINFNTGVIQENKGYYPQLTTIDRSVDPVAYAESIQNRIDIIKNTIETGGSDHSLGQTLFQLELALEEGVYSVVRNADGELAEIRITDTNGVVRHEFIMGSLEQDETLENIYNENGQLIIQRVRDKKTGEVLRTSVDTVNHFDSENRLIGWTTTKYTADGQKRIWAKAVHVDAVTGKTKRESLTEYDKNNRAFRHLKISYHSDGLTIKTTDDYKFNPSTAKKIRRVVKQYNIDGQLYRKVIIRYRADGQTRLNSITSRINPNTGKVTRVVRQFFNRNNKLYRRVVLHYQSDGKSVRARVVVKMDPNNDKRKFRSVTYYRAKKVFRQVVAHYHSDGKTLRRKVVKFFNPKTGKIARMSINFYTINNVLRRRFILNYKSDGRPTIVMRRTIPV